MAETTFFGNRGKLYLVNDPDGTPDSDEIAILKGVEVTVQAEHQELYGMGSIKRQAVARHTAKVEVKIKSAKFDPAMATGLGLAYKSILDGDASGALTITDTNTVALFDLRLYAKGTGETNYLKVTVSDVYFPDIPFPLPENDWVVFELSGTGSDVTFLDNQTPA